MATCSNCGNPIGAEDAFCRSCGAKAVQAEPEPEASAPPAPVSDPPPAPMSDPPHVQPAQPAQAPPAQAPAPTAAPTARAPSTVFGQMSGNGWLLIAGAVAVFVGSLLPWVEATGGFGITVSASPRSGGVVLFLILAAAVIALGWPATRGGLSMRRWIGLTLVAALLTLFAITNWSDLSDVENANPGINVSAGGGLFLYTAGVAAIWVCVVRLLLARRRVAAAHA